MPSVIILSVTNKTIRLSGYCVECRGANKSARNQTKKEFTHSKPIVPKCSWLSHLNSQIRRGDLDFMLESGRGGRFEIIVGDRSKGGQNHLDGFRPVGANEPGTGVFKLSLLVSNGGAK